MALFESRWTSPRMLLGWALTLGALVSGCGGSGSSETSTTTTTPSAGSSSTSSAGSTSSSNSGCGQSDITTSMRTAINAQRAATRSCGRAGTFAAASPLTAHSALTQAAVRHSNDMASHSMLSHTGSDGSSVDSRVTDAGYPWITLAENIGEGYADVAAVVAGWMASDDHCANIMDASMKEIGAACTQATDGTRYWTLVVGAR